MYNTNDNNKKKTTATPVSLLIAKHVEDAKANGEYCNETDTWSNRDYELTTSKKHCEQM